MKFYLIIFYLILFSPKTVESSTKLIRFKGLNVEFSPPNDWKYYQNFNKIPHLFLSPENNSEGTSSLSIRIYSTSDKSSALFRDINFVEKDYKKNKSDWAKKTDVTIIEFIPYKLISTQNNVKIHRFGLHFKLNREKFWDYMYFIECPNTVLKFKSFFSDKQKNHFQLIQETIETIKCSKTSTNLQ